MRVHIVLFALGAWLMQRRPELPDLRIAWTLVLVAPAVLCAQSHRPLVRRAGAGVCALAACAAGFLWAATLAHLRMSDELPRDWEGRDIEAVGVVAGLPQRYERSVRFEFDVEEVHTAGARLPRRIVLSWWGRTRADTAPDLPELRAGERWRLTVRLKRPHGFVNPGGYDYEAALLERGLRATGYVRSAAGAVRLAGRVHRPSYWVGMARERLRGRILDALSDRPYAGIIAALGIGDQRAIAPAQWQVFTRTGVNHLMSISGLHVTMVSGFAYALAAFAWRRSARLTLRLPARKAAALAGVAAAFFYTLLAGFAVPAQRTLYMVSVVALHLWCGRAVGASSVLAGALFVVVVLDPWAVTAAGFWLSFGAVAVILFVMTHRLGEPHWLASATRTQAAVTLALCPLLLALFQQVSVVSPLANAFAIPVVSFLVVPLTLVGMVAPFDALLALAHSTMSACMAVLEWMSALPDAVWQQHSPEGWTVPLALAGVLLLLAPRGLPGRWLGALACLPLFLMAPQPPRSGEVRLAVLDVGHGLAVAVQTARHALLYDTGPAWGADVDSGNRIVAPYLRASGVRRLDALVLSHDDIDHTGGAISVLQALPVVAMMTSLPDADPLPLLAERALRCAAGYAWTWDEVHFEFLHPPAESYAFALRDNDRSCVLRITAPGGRVLIAGDIERRAEAMLQESAADLSADVLVAPHQGSRTSSTAAFVEEVRPRAVIFPVGYRNRFGHPHEEVLARYRALGATLYRTDHDGAVLVTLPREGPIAVRRWRLVHRRYWLAAPAAHPPGAPEAALPFSER
jgi:competence protein ComEC